VQYPSIRIEGSILSGDIIDAIEQGEKGFQKAKDFGLEPTSKVKDEIANAWADARDQWRIYRRKVDNLKEGKTGTTETRNFWMIPFLGLLGYQPDLARKGEGVVSLANVLGSNSFDLLIAVPAGVLIAGTLAFQFDIAMPLVVFLGLATVLLFVQIRTGLVLSKPESISLLVLYGVFIVWMILEQVDVMSILPEEVPGPAE